LVLHSWLFLIANLAAWHRRKDVLIVLMIGPVITSALALVAQPWSDPNWFQIVAVCSIGLEHISIR
jgi:hypothetical protein